MLESPVNKIIYPSVNGTDTVFPYDFIVLAADHMKVYVDSVEQATGWGIDGLGNPTGGNVIFAIAPSAGSSVTLLREVPLTQLIDYTPYDRFPAETHEAGLDKLTMAVQQIDEAVDRTVKGPVDDDGSFDWTFPSLDPGYGIQANEAGDALEQTDAPIVGIITAAEAARDAAEVAEANALAHSVNSANCAAESYDSSQDSQLRAWEAEAEAMTADSYATQAEDVFVNTYTSDGDGTFTATPTTDYSALHWAAKAEAAIPDVLYDAYAKVSDVKSSGSHGGTFTSGAWQTRDINTEDSDADSLLSISANQITLEAGTYRCLISCPGYRVDSHKSRLYDTTGTATLLEGTTGHAGAAGVSTTTSFTKGRFTLSEQSVLEVQHRCSTTVTPGGFGLAAGFGVDEVYTIAEFWRES